MRLRRLSPILTICVIPAAVLGACGDDDDAAEPTQPPSIAASATTAPSATRAPEGPTAAPTSAAEAAVVGVADVGGEAVLVDSRGYTLYTFDSDVTGSGASACTGGCATAWQPVEAWDDTPEGPAELSGELTAVTRDDGTLQVVYEGKPLYLYAGDTAAGQATGDGVGGVWHVATVEGGEAASSTGADGYY